MSRPEHRSPLHRWRVVALVVVVVGGVALASVGASSAPAPAPAPSALAGAPDAESSAWYCTGQTTASGPAPGFLVITNTTGSPVTTTISAVSDSGAQTHATVAVPAHGVVTPPVAAVASGGWEAQTVLVSGGGVTVSQVVQSSLGWSEAPCRSVTSAQWYFPGGSTVGNNQLAVSLFNPTPTPVVVDLSFVTPTGTVEPINYQGIVLDPGQVVAENVAAEVQDAATVSTIVSTRTGRVVAAEVEQFEGSATGLSLVTGAVAPQDFWAIPLAQESPGGTSEIDVFNPGPSTESVTVDLRLPSGPLAPLTGHVGPGTTWSLATSAQTRIPQSQSYSVTVSASGGGGVVVGRTVLRPGASESPKAGMTLAVEGLSAAWPPGRWVVPPPGTGATLPVAGAAPGYLALLNASGASETYSATAWTGTGTHTVATGTLGAGTMVLVAGTPLDQAGLGQIVVAASGPMAINEDAAPSGGIGVVSLPGIALAPLIGAG